MDNLVILFMILSGLLVLFGGYVYYQDHKKSPDSNTKKPV